MIIFVGIVNIFFLLDEYNYTCKSKNNRSEGRSDMTQLNAFYEGAKWAVNTHINDLKDIKCRIEQSILIPDITRQILLDDINTRIKICNNRFNNINQKGGEKK